MDGVAGGPAIKPHKNTDPVNPERPMYTVQYVDNLNYIYIPSYRTYTIPHWVYNIVTYSQGTVAKDI